MIPLRYRPTHQSSPQSESIVREERKVPKQIRESVFLTNIRIYYARRNYHVDLNGLSTAGAVPQEKEGGNPKLQQQQQVVVTDNQG